MYHSCGRRQHGRGMLLSLAPVPLLVAASGESRRVNWYVPSVGISPSVDGLNNSAWAAAHLDAITGYIYCCSCWAICPHSSDPVQDLACHFPNGTARPTGTFVNSGRCPGLSGYSAGGPPWPGGNGIPKGTPRPRGSTWPLLTQETRAVHALGLDVFASAAPTTEALLNEYWARPGSLQSAVDLLQREGWNGLVLDNEIRGPVPNAASPKFPEWDPRLPLMYKAFVGNLSAALSQAGMVLVSDVTSTWHGDLGGPEYLPSYAAAAPSMHVMDMATYFNSLPNRYTSACSSQVGPLLHAQHCPVRSSTL